MSPTAGFENFVRVANELAGAKIGKPSREDIVRLVCGDCEFYDPDEEEELECAAFKLVTFIFENELVKPANVAGLISQ